MEAVDQPLRRHGTARIEEQEGEQGAGVGAARVDGSAVGVAQVRGPGTPKRMRWHLAGSGAAGHGKKPAHQEVDRLSAANQAVAAR
ncbi:hypothetical protein GCM10027072_68000 [Streptomyces bullii]